MIHRVIQPTTVWSFRPTECLCVGLENKHRVKVILREEYREGRWEMRGETQIHRDRDGAGREVCVCMCGVCA